MGEKRKKSSQPNKPNPIWYCCSAAAPYLQNRQYDSLVKRLRLVTRLLQGLVERKVEPLVLLDIITNAREEDKIVESLSHAGVHVRRKEAHGLVHGTRAPTLVPKEEEGKQEGRIDIDNLLSSLLQA